MSLLAEVLRLLERERVPHALIGAAAMAVRGVSRSTADVDLLCVDSGVLRREAWAAFEARRLLLERRPRLADLRREGGRVPLPRGLRAGVVAGRRQAAQVHAPSREIPFLHDFSASLRLLLALPILILAESTVDGQWRQNVCEFVRCRLVSRAELPASPACGSYS